MKPLETRSRFRSQLEGLGLDPDHLDPWSGWLAFKEFLKDEVGGLYDAASVQVRPEDDATSLFFVRQFTQREDRRADAPDMLIGRLIVEFDYDSRAFAQQ